MKRIVEFDKDDLQKLVAECYGADEDDVKIEVGTASYGPDNQSYQKSYVKVTVILRETNPNVKVYFKNVSENLKNHCIL